MEEREKGAEKPKRTAEEQEALKKSRKQRRIQRKAEEAAAQDKEKQQAQWRTFNSTKRLFRSAWS